MDAKVTVQEMAEAVGCAEPPEDTDAAFAMLTAARNYIIAAESQLAERDAQIKRAEALVAARDAQIVERELQIAELRKVTGPTCPKCGGYAKIRHEIRVPWIPGAKRCLIREAQNDTETVGDVICISVADLLTNHPLIAAELGLEANDAAE